MFSKACEYGIRATLFIAQKSLTNERVSLKDIVDETESPIAFTAKILQQLVKGGILVSIKGKTGGFEIPLDLIHSIKLSQIIDALDGNGIYTGCALGLKNCDANKPCPVHDKFVAIRNDLKDMLEKTNLYELATNLETGLAYLKR